MELFDACLPGLGLLVEAPRGAHPLVEPEELTELEAPGHQPLARRGVGFGYR